MTTKLSRFVIRWFSFLFTFGADGGAVREEGEVKQKLDEVRTLAIQLFNAGRRQKQKHGPEIWSDTQWRDLPSESVEVWDAIAIEAFKRLKRH